MTEAREAAGGSAAGGPAGGASAGGRDAADGTAGRGDDPEPIPLLDLSDDIGARESEYMDALREVVRSGRFILGPAVREFEASAADFLGARHAVGVNSGTDALVIGLRALGIGEGDQVVTPSFTFFATPESIETVGAEPVFADIEPDSFDLDPDRVEAAVTERTAAILPVHLFGRPARMDRLLEIAASRKLAVLEDCAQSFGAPCGARLTGTLGDVGAYSFFPSKNLGGFGDGGLIVTDDDEVAGRAAMLRTHGGRDKYHNETVGYNSRLDALQAAVLKVKLRRVREMTRGRREAARRYEGLLADLDGVRTPGLADGHVFHQYTVRVTGGRRDRVRSRLGEAGISTGVYYPVPCHRLPVYDDRDVPDLPATEQAAGEVLSLPIWPEITEDQQARVAEALAGALE